jgi:hypothetical protein
MLNELLTAVAISMQGGLEYAFVLEGCLTRLNGLEI